jgi:hypothetical protein
VGLERLKSEQTTIGVRVARGVGNVANVDHKHPDKLELDNAIE